MLKYVFAPYHPAKSSPRMSMLSFFSAQHLEVFLNEYVLKGFQR